MLEQRLGEFISAGDDLCQVVDRSTTRGRILVRDMDLQDVSPGAVVHLKFLAYPY